MILAILMGLFAGTTIVTAFGWFVERQTSAAHLETIQSLIDRVQAPDLQTFKTFNPPEDSGFPEPNFKILTDPSGRVRQYVPLETE